MKRKIVCFVSYYIPSYKAGGCVTAVANLVNALSHYYDFWIITRDRDLNDSQSFPDVSVNKWQTVGNAQVYYTSPDRRGFLDIVKIIKPISCDVIYLNSCFDCCFSIKPLLLNKFAKSLKKPIILAPKGEFSVASLVGWKGLEKKIFMLISKLICLYDVAWHASSDCEFYDIKKTVGANDKNIYLAFDFPMKTNYFVTKENMIDKELTDVLRVIFLSRITGVKNLKYCLDILKELTIMVEFNIYGPVEDERYWELCQKIIDELPKNITVFYHGSVMPNAVPSVFAKNDIFFFPTKGEGYGHVIAESLNVGTPVLLSDQTHWRNLQERSIGWDISFEEKQKFIDVLISYAKKGIEEKRALRSYIVKKRYEEQENSNVLIANRKMFDDVIFQCVH